MKKYLIILCIPLLFACGKDEAEDEVIVDPIEVVDSVRVFQIECLNQINFARTEPKNYADKYLKPLDDDNGAYEDLASRPALNALELHDLINKAAMDYAKLLAKKDLTNHSADGTPLSRLQRVGYNYYCAENLAFGSFSYYNAEKSPRTAAMEFVRALIVDKGVASLGHRKNIFHTKAKKLGVGFGRNTDSKYVNYMVHNFGTK